MALCPNCGASVTDNAPSCPSCGIAFQQNPAYYNNQPYPPQQPVYVQQPQPPVTSVGGWFGWMLLICLLPFFGLLIMRASTQDPSAKNYATCGLIMQLIALVLTVLFILFFVFIVVSM